MLIGRASHFKHTISHYQNVSFHIKKIIGKLRILFSIILHLFHLCGCHSKYLTMTSSNLHSHYIQISCKTNHRQRTFFQTEAENEWRELKKIFVAICLSLCRGDCWEANSMKRSCIFPNFEDWHEKVSESAFFLCVS